jgi:hypothetical protein
MRHLKFIVSRAVAAGTILGIGSAFAADLPAKVYTKAPQVVPMYNWTGCYIGAVGGGEVGRSRSVSNGTNNGVANGTAGATKNDTDLSGGNAGAPSAATTSRVSGSSASRETIPGPIAPAALICSLPSTPHSPKTSIHAGLQRFAVVPALPSVPRAMYYGTERQAAPLRT